MKQSHRKHRMPPSLVEAVNNFGCAVQDETLRAGARVSFKNSFPHKALMKAIREYAGQHVDPGPKPA